MSDGTPEAAAIAAGVVLVKMGSKNANIRRAGDNVAYVGEVLTGLLKTALMPLAVVNARAQMYFDSKFPSDLTEKMGAVPPEFIASPKPSVAGPVMQGLGYSHEEDSLRDLYVSLLATAMDSRVAANAHPGFAEIIGALSANEVQFLNVVLHSAATATTELRLQTAGTEGWNVAYSHLVNMIRTGQPVVDAMLPAYIDNWARLGLVQVDYASFLTADNAYTWVEGRPEYQTLLPSLDANQTMTFERGIIRRTAFGVAFATAVGVL